MMRSLFLFANGRVAALERDFIQQRSWQMLLAARDLEETERLLADTWYGRFLSRGDIESCFDQAMQATEQELVELSEDPALVRGLLHRRDARNARYLWKASLLGGTTEPELERPGLIPVEVLAAAAAADPGEEQDLPPLFAKALSEAREAARSGVAAVDMVMDRLAAAVELEDLPGMDPGFEAYARTRMDILNFQAAGRCRLAGMDLPAIEAMLLPGGSREPGELAKAAVAGQLPQAAAETPGMEHLAGVLREALAGGSFLEYQREAERTLMEMLDIGSFAVFGPAPLAAFLLKREMEIAHLRILFASRAAGMDRSRLHRRLPRG